MTTRYQQMEQQHESSSSVISDLKQRLKEVEERARVTDDDHRKRIQTVEQEKSEINK